MYKPLFIDTLNSYTEISPSGYGVHIFVKADIPLPFHKKSMKPNAIVRIVNDKQKTPELEIYNSGRYFTMTGKVFGTSRGIEERGRELQDIIDLYTTKENFSRNELSLSFPEHEILKIMFGSKKGEKYKSLYGGNISEYRSHSEADQALCNILCYFSKGNKSVIDSLFRQSRLMRSKWDEKHGADTYGNITIQKALNSVKDYYALNTNKSAPLTEWEQPVPFNNVDLPQFPVNELPTVISDYVRAVAETTQTAPDMAATASLAILALSLPRYSNPAIRSVAPMNFPAKSAISANSSISIGSISLAKSRKGKFVIEGKKDWREPLNLYNYRYSSARRA